MNLYLYANQNPINLTDPRGLNSLLLEAEIFYLENANVINENVVDILSPNPPSTIGGYIFNIGPDLTNMLVQANNTLIECSVESIRYAAEDAVPDIMFRGIPYLIDATVNISKGLKDEWIRQNMPSTPPRSIPEIRQAPIR